MLLRVCFTMLTRMVNDYVTVASLSIPTINEQILRAICCTMFVMARRRNKRAGDALTNAESFAWRK